MTTPFLTFGAPDIAADDVAEVMAVMQSGWLGTGPRVERFEKKFAAFKGVGIDQVAAVSSCTAALHLSLLAAGIGPGDEVVTTPLTFCATVNTILQVGARPVLADVDPVSMNIDPARIANAITPRTRAILPVHLAGRPCAMDAILDLATRHSLTVIEDCAHAVEATYHGRPMGTLGDFGCFSFYVTKNVTTGEGGLVLARQPAAREQIKVMSLHGMSRDAWARYSDGGYRHYQVVAPGFKYNMMDLQAAIGLGQLDRVESAWQRRQALWSLYQQGLADLPVILPAPPEPGTRHGLHLYTLLIDPDRCGITRDGFMERMTRSGIGVGVHYLSLTEHPYYQELLGWQPQDTPVATRIGRQTISLPLSPRLTELDVERIIATVHDCLVHIDAPG
ncbi:UDP-4-amino-4,6-dideoxy-N-acetyl-beta-L-altrosamine transaminase [alpha proteobacterium AAP38]|uniref:DegT/DnrJ/EryC1/StrS family aminotransferase n=1 Tax=Niveispirillum sp. TaxID=1917217 RepID=UPI0006B8DDCA|nr:UDP-4-amino-4,6-dideoxy-N-acetyl-beta-L-altrosamine transaminase [alpha proteobacterium AAP38]